jgi:hypothetical protein
MQPKKVEMEIDKEHWVRWQIIKRKSDYINFCDSLPKYFFDMQSRFISMFHDELSLELENKYGLRNIYHHSKEFTPEECYENFDIFQITAPVVRIFPEAILDSIGRERLVEILGSPGQLVYDEPDDGSINGRILNIEASLGFPPAKGFVYFGVNIADEVKYADITRYIKRLIKLARASRNIKPKDTRRHLDKREVYFRIWDMRAGKTPFAQIAAKLGMKDKERVIKAFKAAYALIEGKSYDRISWHNMVDDKLVRKAKNSQDPAAFSDVLNHEEGYLREKLIYRKDWWRHVENTDMEKKRPDFFTPKQAGIISNLEFEADIEALCGECPDQSCRESIREVMMTGEGPSVPPCPDFLERLKAYRLL